MHTHCLTHKLFLTLCPPIVTFILLNFNAYAFVLTSTFLVHTPYYRDLDTHLKYTKIVI